MILFKMGKHSDFQLSFFQIVGAWDFTVVAKVIVISCDLIHDTKHSVVVVVLYM